MRTASSSFLTGRQAEAVALDFLVAQGYKAIDQNWRNRWCEIDLIIQQHNKLVFVEVKYRHSNQQGRGLDYITAAKLRQMDFAARVWVQHHNWPGDYSLGAIELFGDNFVVGEFVADIT